MLKHTSVLLLSALSLPAVAAPETYTIDPAHTYPYFEAKHLGMSTIRGRFDKTTGKITLDLAAKSGALDVSIDAALLNTGAPKPDNGLRSRDEHLRSGDFFNVAEFPTLTYKSSKFNFKGGAPESIDGSLTLLGITKPVKLTVTSFKCGTNPIMKKEMCGADAVAKIKRSDFGMMTFIPLVSDEIAVLLNVEAYKN